MPRFNVNLFPLVVVKVPGIEADSYEEAVEKAREQAELHRLNGNLNGLDVGYGEEIAYYVVDVEGDEEYRQTKTFIDPIHANEVNSESLLVLQEPAGSA